MANKIRRVSLKVVHLCSFLVTSDPVDLGLCIVVMHVDKVKPKKKGNDVCLDSADLLVCGFCVVVCPCLIQSWLAHLLVSVLLLQDIMIQYDAIEDE